MKATYKVLLYVGLSAGGLLLVSVAVFWAWLRWEYYLPDEQTARRQFSEASPRQEMLDRSLRSRVPSRGNAFVSVITQ